MSDIVKRLRADRPVKQFDSAGRIIAFDATPTSLEIEAADEIERLRQALIKLRDCDWVITPRDRMDAVREIARAALANTKPDAT